MAVAVIMIAVTAATGTLSGCGGGGDDSALGAPAPAGPALEPAPTLAGRGLEVAARASVRDGDVTDIDELARRMARGSTGDADWIDIFARLRAQSWLAARYPGRYDLAETYRDEARDAAEANQDESLELGVYLDEPLPGLVSVIRTRDLGELVELEVVLEAGPATVRGDGDDTPRGVLPGGIHRGLFVLGQDGPDGHWRIHSVVELHVGDRPTGQEPSS